MTSAAVQLAPSPQKFAVLYLSELVKSTGSTSRDGLFTPLTLAYLLSMHIPFFIPVTSNSLVLAESVFDQVLNGHSLRSKGMIYKYLDGDGTLDALVSSAVLVISDEKAEVPAAEYQPHAIVCSTASGYAVHLLNASNLMDEALRGQLVGCSQLINIQSGDFLLEGPLSIFHQRKSCRRSGGAGAA